jgi:hypothetical protein
MKISSFDPIAYGQPVGRGALINLLEAALEKREYRFARQLALVWLAAFPGDLGINLYLAKSLLGEERRFQVTPILNNLVTADPEYLAAYELLASMVPESSEEIIENARASIFALGGRVGTILKLPEWSVQLRTARDALRRTKLDEASDLVHKAVSAGPQSVLAAVIHMEVARKTMQMEELNNLANVYHKRWPDCLQFTLLLAESKLKSGDETGAVALLHLSASRDPSGQVATRLWGADHTYRPIWPDRMEIAFDLPVPAPVAATLGWNQLPETTSVEQVEPPRGNTPPDETPAEASSSDIDVLMPETASSNGIGTGNGKAQQTSETVRAVQAELDRMAKRLKKAGPGRVDGRFPLYVVLSTRHGLESQYGPQTAAILIEEMQRLILAVRKREGWGALLYLADDPAATTPLGLKPVAAGDPWKIKLALSDLDAALSKRGEMIGALLIVGGPAVVPFHRLPNPTDDADAEVNSDNPYATLDENYFVPEWPVGRLPGENGSDAGLLLDNLRSLVNNHNAQSGVPAWWRRIFGIEFLRGLSRWFGANRSNGKLPPSFGYTAAVWKRSSQAVFTPIGEPRDMLISPPVGSGNLANTGLAPAKVEYFNLHGVQDGAEWYGQRDLSDSSDGPDYPVALSPKDVQENGKASKVIFTEACYGAHIDGKTEDQALSLKFLSLGTLAFVGSTCISYGSVTTPLIAADLLGNSFWKRIKEGQSAGFALQQAKIGLVQEMNRRQGYLDGEDQKTLISFVLYGDPLMELSSESDGQKAVLRSRQRPEVMTTCDVPDQTNAPERIPMEVVSQVKQIVNQYLPGLKDAELSFVEQRVPVSEQKKGHSSLKGNADNHARRVVVTLSKKINVSSHVHRHYARMTLDAQGKVLKLSMSR